MDTKTLVQVILRQYPLTPQGRHGVFHWARVLENGLRLAELTGANETVVTLFALFHDSRRINEHWDEGHGFRGGEFARRLRTSHLDLSDEDFDLFYRACCLHTDGHVEGELTLKVCWDADRLDLGRVGIRPDPEKLCTDAARNLISWAHARAEAGYQPGWVSKIWGIGGI